MKFVERKDLDEAQWADWCAKSPDNNPFCRLEYLDALNEKVVFLIDENRGGIALPYKQNLGIKTLFTPVFCRWITWVGDRKVTLESLQKKIFSEFTQGNVYAQQDLFQEKKHVLIYQTVEPTKFSLNTQAKRKIKKASTESWTVVWNKPAKKAIDLIEENLKNKFETLENSSFLKLRSLAANFQNIGQLKVVSLMNEKQVMIGSLILIATENRLLYLKGACDEKAKLQGGMYTLMNEAIKSAADKGQTFDFGGSRIPGVRKFNRSFGAEDQTYFQFEWNKGPFWFSCLKYIKKRLKE